MENAPFTYRPLIETDTSWFGRGEHLAGYQIVYDDIVVYTVRQNKQWVEKYVKMLNLGYETGYNEAKREQK